MSPCDKERLRLWSLGISSVVIRKLGSLAAQRIFSLTFKPRNDFRRLSSVLLLDSVRLSFIADWLRMEESSPGD